MGAYLGLGSNLGDRLATLQRAIDLLADDAGIVVDARRGSGRPIPSAAPSNPTSSTSSRRSRPTSNRTACSRPSLAWKPARPDARRPLGPSHDRHRHPAHRRPDDRRRRPHRPPPPDARASVRHHAPPRTPRRPHPPRRHPPPRRPPPRPSARPYAPPLASCHDRTPDCLRCDWQGETGVDVSGCAAPLYELGRTPVGRGGSRGKEPLRGAEPRSGEHRKRGPVRGPAPPVEPPAPPRRRKQPSPRPRAPGRSSPSSSPSSSWPSPSARGSTPTRRRSKRQRRSPGRSRVAAPHGHARLRGPGRRGSLTALAVRPRDRTAVRGPRVRRAIEWSTLVASTSGWLGLTSELPNGRVQASILASSAPRPGRRRSWRATW